MYINGIINIKIRFNDLDVESDSESDILDSLFPDGWEGELDVTDISYEE